MTRIDRDAVTADWLLEAGYTPDEVRRMISAGRGGVRWLVGSVAYRATSTPPELRALYPPVFRSEHFTPGWVDRDVYPGIPDSHFDLDRSPPHPIRGAPLVTEEPSNG